VGKVPAVPRRRLLDSTELFTAMPADVLDGLRDQAVLRAFPKGQAVFSAGDPAHHLYVVAEGRVAIASRAADGRETLVAVMEPGGLFGELGLFDGEPRSADARALTDVEVLAVDYTAVRAAFEARPELLWLIVRLLAQRLRATDEALADAVFLDVPARTAKRLLELAGDRDEFQLPMTQEDLAGLVGASRERVNKALAMFTRLGWVETTGRGHYHILDRESLEQRAEQ
jgi:CRP-like cAMP-binding protein